jgi:hypothetical protein
MIPSGTLVAFFPDTMSTQTMHPADVANLPKILICSDAVCVFPPFKRTLSEGLQIHTARIADLDAAIAFMVEKFPAAAYQVEFRGARKSSVPKFQARLQAAGVTIA